MRLDDDWSSDNDLILAIDNALFDIHGITGAPADIIVIVPPGSLGAGIVSSALRSEHGQCQLVAGYGSCVSDDASHIDDVLARCS
jgi:hypothetical protein